MYCYYNIKTTLSYTEKRSRLFAVALVAVLVMALAVPSFAAPSSMIDSISGTPSTHIVTLTSNYETIEDRQIRLNIFTESYPVAGNKVTTWGKTKSETQQWGYVVGMSNNIPGGADVLASVANPSVCLNIARVAGNPEANVANILRNRFADVNIMRTTNRAYVGPLGVHTTNMYLTETSSIPNSGGGKYVIWSPSGSNFYQYDMSWHSY